MISNCFRRSAIYFSVAVCIIILTTSVSAVSFYIYIVACTQDEWVAIKLGEMAKLNMLDIERINTSLEMSGKDYRLDTEMRSSMGYIGVSQDYILNGTPMMNVRWAALASVVMSILGSTAVVAIVVFGKTSKVEESQALG